MDVLDKSQHSAELEARARRAKHIILWVMSFLILLPFLLLWFTGAVRF